MKDWRDKATDKEKDKPTINMTMSNDMNQIESEYRNKFAYDNMLSDLFEFIYTRFLMSDPKYTQMGYIAETESRGRRHYKITDK